MIKVKQRLSSEEKLNQRILKNSFDEPAHLCYLDCMDTPAWRATILRKLL